MPFLDLPTALGRVPWHDLFEPAERLVGNKREEPMEVSIQEER
ncbi:MAG: hypothetical protein OXO50_13360 [Caldilineaceae bacterium]|nr:hypothetical protein [Caldilineaceae bacterium]